MQLSVKKCLSKLLELKKAASDLPFSLEYFYGKKDADPGKIYSSISEFYGEIKKCR